MNKEERNQKIYAVIEAIPPGRVASYGQIAEFAGLPRGARQVAYALRCLPRGHNLPWFRIITASGKLAFDRDSVAFKRQRDTLLSEGVPVQDGKVDMRQYRWQATIDEQIWGPESHWGGE